jgi:hypothetical protein
MKIPLANRFGNASCPDGGFDEDEALFLMDGDPSAVAAVTSPAGIPTRFTVDSSSANCPQSAPGSAPALGHAA